MDSATYDLSLLFYKGTICFLISKYLCKFFFVPPDGIEPPYSESKSDVINLYTKGDYILTNDVNEQKKPWTFLVQGFYYKK